MRARTALAALAALSVWACGRSAEPRPESAPDTLTRREKDSLVSTLPIPGASGIQGAQKAQDRAAQRAAQLDSIR